MNKQTSKETITSLREFNAKLLGIGELAIEIASSRRFVTACKWNTAETDVIKLFKSVCDRSDISN